MSSGELPVDPQAAALRASLSEINHTLEALRERIHRLSAPEGTRTAPSPEADTIAPVESKALTASQFVLATSASGAPPSEVFSHAMDRVARLLAADRSMLFLVDHDRGELLPTAARGFRRDDLKDLSIKPGEGIVGRAFLEARVLAYSRPADTAASDPFVARFPVRDAIAVPVRAEGQVIGALYAGRRGHEAPFSMDETLLVLLIADRVGMAFSRQRLADRATAHVGRLRELEVFCSQALVGRDLADTLAQACEVGCRLVDVRVVALGTLDEAGSLVLAAASGMRPDVAATWRADPSEGLAREMFTTQGPVAWRDLSERAGGQEAFLAESELRACLVVPVRVRDKTLGVMYLADPRPRDFAPDEAEAAYVLASLTALAIENARLYGGVRTAFDTLSATQERLIHTEKVRALGGMAGGVAHEFNNILAIILGKTQLLLARTLDEPVRDGLGRIEEAAWRAADVVRRLQGFAATRLDEAPAPVDPKALVQDALTLTRGLWKDEAEARGIRIEIVSDLEDTPAVLGSAAELREAVTNLVLNAIDAMPRGGRLSLATRQRDAGVEVAVTDTGEGMSEEVRRRVFDPFFSTRTPPRSGLGLSVVHGIVTRHRGRVEVASQEGRGTTVTVWLPAAAPAPAILETRGEPAAESVPATASILVLEDEEQIRTMLVEALSQAGHTVDSAGDGLTGLARFQSGRFDVVLTDLSLPERSGLDVARAVKRMRPGTPVVLITGWGHLLDPARLRDSGVDLTLVKPFRLEHVLAVLADALRLRRLS